MPANTLTPLWPLSAQEPGLAGLESTLSPSKRDFLLRVHIAKQFILIGAAFFFLLPHALKGHYCCLLKKYLRMKFYPLLSTEEWPTLKQQVPPRHSSLGLVIKKDLNDPWDSWDPISFTQVCCWALKGPLWKWRSKGSTLTTFQWKSNLLITFSIMKYSNHSNFNYKLRPPQSCD